MVKIEENLSNYLLGKQTQFGIVDKCEVRLLGSFVEADGTIQAELVVRLRPKPKRYSWLWVCEWSDGSSTTKRSEHTPRFSRIPCDYENQEYTTYRIEESKQEVV